MNTSNELWNNIVKNKEESRLFKNFHDPEMDWNDVMNFMYQQATNRSGFKQNEEEKKQHPNVILNGSLKTQPGLYIIPLIRDIHNFFHSAYTLMQKISGDKKVNSCDYYKGNDNDFPCNCGSIWHIQGLRLSVSDIVINHHHDPCDVLVWQMVGKSYWTINKKNEYELAPGDLMYVSKDATHGIHQTGPRLTMIIDGIKSKYGVKNE